MAAPETPTPSTPAATSAQSQSRDGDAPAPANVAIVDSPLECDISPRALRAASVRPHEREAGQPLYRPLRVYTQDPTVSRRNGAIATINVSYETLAPGPVGALLEVVDDGASDELAAGNSSPLDLDAPFVMMQQGLDPSPSNACFRAQNAYAICSTTYAAFRQALGRELTWGFTRGGPADANERLRLRTNYSGDRNAYYDSASGELRFGAFSAAQEVSGKNVPFGLVYTALQHDVIVHEMSHALLDGLRSHLLMPTNADVLAFHEGFADLVAIFQRFTYADVVRSGIRSSRGRLRDAPVFTNIALQFGQTTGLHTALRSAVLGAGCRHEDSTEPHERGSVLVAAVYEAFSTVYERKIARVMKLASGGTGILPEGELPELLIDEMTDEARKLASHFLSICIRAIDYCPPVDLTFGEYLRALITADMDLVPDDPWQYREALIDAFRAHNIYPRDQRNLAEETLRWCEPGTRIPPCDPLAFGKLRFRGDPATPANARELERQALTLGRLVGTTANRAEFGVLPPHHPSIGADTVGRPIVDSIRSARRVGPDGQTAFDLVAEVVQCRTVAATAQAPSFHFYGGSTIILDPVGRVRYVIRKRIDDGARIARQSQFIGAAGAALWRPGPSQRMIPDPGVLLAIHKAARAVQPERKAGK